MSFHTARVLPILALTVSLEPVIILATDTVLTMFGRDEEVVQAVLSVWQRKWFHSVMKYKLWGCLMRSRLGVPRPISTNIQDSHCQINREISRMLDFSIRALLSLNHILGSTPCALVCLLGVISVFIPLDSFGAEWMNYFLLVNYLSWTFSFLFWFFVLWIVKRPWF